MKLLQTLASFSNVKVKIWDFDEIKESKKHEENPFIKCMNEYKERVNKNKLLAEMWNKLNSINSSLTVDRGFDNIRINIVDISQLHEASSLAKQVIPNYKYKLDTIYVPHGERVVVKWKDDDNFIKIKLLTTVEDFPEELKKDSCGFKTVKHKTFVREEYEEIAYICDGGN